jgi:hypothetical protein
MGRSSPVQFAWRARLYPLGGPVPAGWRRFEAFERLLSSTRSRPGPDVLYLGDSVVERVSRDDADPTTLGGMVAAAVAPRLRTLVITHSAYNPDVYLPLVESLNLAKVRPRALLLPVNLRCFSPQWMCHPLWQFEDEIAVLRQRRARWPRRAPLLRIPEDPSAEAMRRYDAIRLDRGAPGMETLGDFRRLIAERPEDEGGRIRRLQAVFSLHYRFELRPQLPRLQALRGCVAAAQRLGIAPVVYLTPVNVEAGDRLLGDAFTGEVERNVRVILEALRAAGVDAADHSRTFSSAEFFHVNEPTEHLNAAGRQRLAALLAHTLAQRLAVSQAP